MIDLKILRSQPELLKQAIRNKGAKVDLDLLFELDANQAALLRQVEEMRAERNRLAATMKAGRPDPTAIAAARALREELSRLEPALNVAKSEFLGVYKQVPNIPTDDTPVGLSEEDNVVVRVWGEPRAFTYPPRNHYEIASHHDWIDKDRAAKVAGARFAYLKGDLVKLQFALVAWVLDRLNGAEHFADIIAEAQTQSAETVHTVLPPSLIRTTLYDAMDRLEPVEERYRIEGESLWLQGSAEHVLGSMHADEIFDEQELPVRYLGYATSFRREAGAAGRDMEGIIRLHQFDKLEMESFSTKETSHFEHLFFSAIQERLMQLLEIPYRKLQKCTHDIGKPNAKGSDMERWLPPEQVRTHTADYMTDYQARRLNTRVRRSTGSLSLFTRMTRRRSPAAARSWRSLRTTKVRTCR